MKHLYSRGFTLIELLVVIAIIGLLASTVLASLQTARIEARDAKRLNEARELTKALEIYRNANGGLYPCNTASPLTGNCPSLATSVINASTPGATDTALLTALRYTPASDPIRAAGTIEYRVTSATNRAGYGVRVYKESLSGWCLHSTMGAGVSGWASLPAC